MDPGELDADGCIHFISLPVLDSRPVAPSILKTTTLLVSWFAEKRYAPVGSILKLRGIIPPLSTCSTGVNVPSF